MQIEKLPRWDACPFVSTKHGEFFPNHREPGERAKILEMAKKKFYKISEGCIGVG